MVAEARRQQPPPEGFDLSPADATPVICPAMTTLWHLTEPDAWASAQAEGTYTGSTRDATLAEIGFVHCATPGQLAVVVTAVYHDVVGDFVILELDATALERAGSPVRFEPADPADPTSELFPHVYGPIPATAVTRVIPARVTRGRLRLDGDTLPQS